MTARQLFEKAPFQLQAGVFVFSGILDDEKHKDIRIAVLGVRDAGDVVALYNNDHILGKGAYRYWESGFEKLQKRAMYVYSLDLWGHDVNQLVRFLREDGTFSKFSRYYCHSRHVPNERVNSVYYVWDFKTERYSTGETASRQDVIHQYDCNRDALIPAPYAEAFWPPNGEPGLRPPNAEQRPRERSDPNR